MDLDVGCGTKPLGDVNVDLFVGKSPHLIREEDIIHPKEIPNFIQAHVHYLPFRDNMFQLVTCFEVVEHKGISFPKAICELYRVASKDVKIHVPHRYQRHSFLRYKQFKMHNKFFSVSVLDKWLKNNFNHYELKVIYKDFPSVLLPLIRLPHTIELTIKKYLSVLES